MAVDHIRLEADYRQGRKSSPAEKAELFQIPVPIAIWLFSVKIAFIINKIKCDPLMDIL